MAEIGVLTGGLAHEIRNPLSTVKLNLQLLAEDLERLLKQTAGAGESPPLQELRRLWERHLRRIRTVGAEADRLGETLNDFLRYTGKLELNPVRVDVNEVLDELIDFYEPQAISQGMQVRKRLSERPLQCRVDVDLLKQALLNLFINAVQAMDRSGELIIQSSPAGDCARIDVIDTGPGISPELQSRIFDAYFTTRCGGTGLGLPMTRRIVEEHGGRLELVSEPGKGSDFAIVLPLSEE